MFNEFSIPCIEMFVGKGLGGGGGVCITEGRVCSEEQECLSNSEFTYLKLSYLEDPNLDI